MKSSQYARAQRFLREIPLVERAPGEQQQTLSEAKPMSQHLAGVRWQAFCVPSARES